MNFHIRHKAVMRNTEIVTSLTGSYVKTPSLHNLACSWNIRSVSWNAEVIQPRSWILEGENYCLYLRRVYKFYLDSPLLQVINLSPADTGCFDVFLFSCFSMTGVCLSVVVPEQASIVLSLHARVAPLACYRATEALIESENRAPQPNIASSLSVDLVCVRSALYHTQLHESPRDWLSFISG